MKQGRRANALRPCLRTVGEDLYLLMHVLPELFLEQIGQHKENGQEQ